MENNIFKKLTAEEQDQLWMYMIFNKDKIIEKTEEWTKEAEKRDMTLTEYLESINPINEANKIDVIDKGKKMELIYKLRICLAYYMMPKDTRKYLINALSDNIKELEKELQQAEIEED